MEIWQRSPLWILKETAGTSGFEELCQPVKVKKELLVETNGVVTTAEGTQQVNHVKGKEILVLRYDLTCMLKMTNHSFCIHRCGWRANQ